MFLLVVKTIAKTVAYLTLAFAAALLWKLHPVILRYFTSPLKHLPGPPNDSWFRGNTEAIDVEDNSVPQERWSRECGSHTITYRGPLSVRFYFSCFMLLTDRSLFLRADRPLVVY